MALNHGTYCSSACQDVLRRYHSRTALRHYGSADDRELREAIAAVNGVSWEHVLLGHGSGALLKSAIPYVIEQRIRQSPGRIVRHLALRRGYPITTPRMTYFKVPHGALRMGLGVDLLPLARENQFAFSTSALVARLKRGAALVYLSNPNNPTGNLLLSRDELLPIVQQFPDSTFVVDEAYVEYLAPERQALCAELVPCRRNLLVLRSFSFAYGLAAARVGYLVADQDLVRELEQKATPHAIGQLSADLVMASLADPEHLPFVRQRTTEERQRLSARLRRHSSLEVYESETNFVLCRLASGWTARQLYDELFRRGVRIKVFDPLGREDFSDYFRVTIGLPEENEFLAEQIDATLGGK